MHLVLTGDFELPLVVTGGWRAAQDVPLLLTGNTRDSSNTLMTFIRRAEFNKKICIFVRLQHSNEL